MSTEGGSSWHTRRTFPAGCQRLDGAASVDLLRQRRYLPDGTLDRDRDAQRYVAGLVRRAVAQDVLTNPVRLTALLSAAGKGLAVDDDGLPLTRLVAVLPEMKSVDPVGLSLPVGPPGRQRFAAAAGPEAGPGVPQSGDEAGAPASGEQVAAHTGDEQ
ncbi:hypothetical protein [Micromonospora sp. U21]|uniref:hypothetical protein n=1 Tax=Micromonospora sp. U21 TaxID=2824899 RepID=UPI001B36F8DA|nr:hypothetical protein [Micromonospora sp. U21]MBQ0904264.1 hypothetical protein [Micromonospora sp. U21]